MNSVLNFYQCLQLVMILFFSTVLTAQGISQINVSNDFIEVKDLKINQLSKDKSEFIGAKKIHLFLNIEDPIPSEITSLSSLKELKVSFYMHPQTFEYFKILDLKSYKIDDLQYSSTENNQNQPTRELFYQKIEILKQIQKNSLKEIEKIENLKELNLSNNSLILIPDSVLTLKNLKKLDFSANSMIKIQQDLGTLESLETLSFNKNYFGDYLGNESLSDYIQCLIEIESTINDQNVTFPKGLKHLNLSTLNINFISRNILNLESLKTLNLSYNLFRTIPSEVNRIKSLEKLDLSNNLMIEDEFKGDFNENIKTLIISGCNLKKIGNFSAPNLVSLDLATNKIEDISCDFYGCPKLENLSLSCNRLIKLPSSLKNLKNLKYLDLSYSSFNVLRPIEFNTLEGLTLKGSTLKKDHINNLLLPNLQKLNIIYCDIPDIQQYVLNLNSIKTLFLGKIKLFKQEELIENHQSIEELYIDCCNIEVKHLKSALNQKKMSNLALILNGGMEYHIPDSIIENKNLKELSISSSFMNKAKFLIHKYKFLDFTKYSLRDYFNFNLVTIDIGNPNLIHRFLKVKIANNLVQKKEINNKEELAGYELTDDFRVLKFLEAGPLKTSDNAYLDYFYCKENEILVVQNEVFFNGISRAILAFRDQMEKLNLDIPHLRMFGVGDSLGVYELKYYFDKVLSLNKKFEESKNQMAIIWKNLNMKNTAGITEINYSFVKEIPVKYQSDGLDDYIDVYLNKNDFNALFDYLYQILKNDKLYDKILIPVESINNCKKEIYRIFSIINNNKEEKLKNILFKFNRYIKKTEDNSFFNRYLIIHSLLFQLEHMNSDDSFEIEEYLVSCISVLKDYILKIIAEFTPDKQKPQEIEEMIFNFKLSTGFLNVKFADIINSTIHQKSIQNLYKVLMLVSDAITNDDVEFYFNFTERNGVRFYSAIKPALIDKILVSMKIYRLKSKKLKSFL